MTVLEFIFSIIALIVGGIVILCVVGLNYSSKKLEEENKKLKEDLEKARKKVVKREYKKAKEVK